MGIIERLDMTRAELDNDGLVGAAEDVRLGMAEIERLRGEWAYKFGYAEAERKSLVDALERIKAHMGACIVQRAPSDDAIIFEHIIAADEIAGHHLKRR